MISMLENSKVHLDGSSEQSTAGRRKTSPFALHSRVSAGDLQSKKESK